MGINSVTHLVHRLCKRLGIVTGDIFRNRLTIQLTARFSEVLGEAFRFRVNRIRD